MAVAALLHSQSWGWFFLVLIAINVGLRAVFYLTSKRHNLELVVRVGGVNEIHAVRFYFDAYRERVRITIDEAPVSVDGHRVPKWGPTTQWEYKVSVDDSEKHAVTFVRTKKPLAGGRRRQSVVPYIDGVVVQPDARQPSLSATP
jgi:hypothetical protein